MTVMQNSLCMFSDAKILFCKFKVIVYLTNIISHLFVNLKCITFTAIFSMYIQLTSAHKHFTKFICYLLLCYQCAGKVNNITVDKCSKMGVVFLVSII